MGMNYQQLRRRITEIETELLGLADWAQTYDAGGHGAGRGPFDWASSPKSRATATRRRCGKLKALLAETRKKADAVRPLSRD
jgi:hypothetical protein